MDGPAPGNQPPSPFGSVTKLQWLRAIAGRRDVSRSTLAACAVLADMADSRNGICWPSYATIADSIATTPRGAKKAIAAAVEAGLIAIAEHGSRVRSNRYRLILDCLGGEQQFTTLGGEQQFTRVVNASAGGGEQEVQDVVNHSSPKSFHQSSCQAKIDGMDRSEGAATPSRPGGLRACRKTGDKFPEFWQAMGGRRTTVAQAERLLAEALADGIDYQEILSGAERYRRYCESTSGQMKSSAAAWLKRQAWRDGWELPTKRKAAAKRIAGKTKQEWREEIFKQGQAIHAECNCRDEFENRITDLHHNWDEQSGLDNVAEQITEHGKNCTLCQGAISEIEDPMGFVPITMDIYLYENDMVYPTQCKQGLKLFEQMKPLYEISELFFELETEMKEKPFKRA